ncbi:MAG TPA: metalloregulator ArsR/SmtB family transcription factor [Kiritimatiellia bacterium]|nr:metalloregulator ArsR/SmtB family transcription factor [Kiritimatiellia bacterium]
MTNLHSIARLGLALSDPTRLRLFAALRDGELCVCQLIELADLAPSTVSKHLSILRDAGLVDSRKDGRWVHYRLAKKGITDVENVAKPFLQTLEKSVEIRADARKLRTIRRADLEVLCRQQRKN